MQSMRVKNPWDHKRAVRNAEVLPVPREHNTYWRNGPRVRNAEPCKTARKPRDVHFELGDVSPGTPAARNRPAVRLYRGRIGTEAGKHGFRSLYPGILILEVSG